MNTTRCSTSFGWRVESFLAKWPASGLEELQSQMQTPEPTPTPTELLIRHGELFRSSQKVKEQSASSVSIFRRNQCSQATSIRRGSLSARSRFYRRCDTDEDHIPLMMLARRSLSVPGKTPLQHFAVLHLGHVDQTPSRKTAAASPSYLITEQPHDSVLDTVVMRLRYSLLTFVSEPNHVLLYNRLSK